MGTRGEIHNDNVIKATMEELTEDERRAYLIAEEHLKEQFLQGFKKERGGLFKRVGEFMMPSFKLLSVETHRRAATGNTKSREVAGALAGTAPSSTACNSVTRPENVWKAGRAT